MAISRGLVISLGVSALGCTLLFLYFRNKISTIERKVDVMMDIIQNHQQEQPTMASMNYKYETQNAQEQERGHQEQQEQQEAGAWNDNSRSDIDLIQVSDDEDDDSEEVSDSDSDEEDDIEQPQKLSLDNVEDMSLELSDVKKITVKESDKVEVNDSIELEEVEDSLDEIDDDDDEEEEEEEEELNKETKQVTVVKEGDESDGDDFDYTKLKVSELKSIAEQKGLSGYKSLKKTPLIELLKSSE